MNAYLWASEMQRYARYAKERYAMRPVTYTSQPQTFIRHSNQEMSQLTLLPNSERSEQ